MPVRHLRCHGHGPKKRNERVGCCCSDSPTATMKRTPSCRHLPDCLLRDSLRRLRLRDPTLIRLDLPCKYHQDVVHVTNCLDNAMMEEGNLPMIASVRIQLPDCHKRRGGGARAQDDDSKTHQEQQERQSDMENLADRFSRLSSLQELEWIEHQWSQSLAHFLERLRQQTTTTATTTSSLTKLSIVSPTMSQAAANELGHHFFMEGLQELRLTSIPSDSLATILRNAVNSPSIRSLHLVMAAAVSQNGAACWWRLADVMRNNPSLRELTVLSRMDHETEFSAGVYECQKALQMESNNHNNNTTSSSSIQRLVSDCLWQHHPRLHHSFGSQLKSLTLHEYPCMGNPSPLLLNSPNLVELILEGSTVSFHNLPKISSLLRSTKAPIRRFVLRRALLARDLIERQQRVRVGEFLKALTSLDELQYLSVGSVGDAFIDGLSAFIKDLGQLRSLTIFVYRSRSIESLVECVRGLQRTTKLTEVNVWPSNPNRRLLPPLQQLQLLNEAVFRHRMNAVDGYSLLKLHNKPAVPNELWPLMISRLGKFPSFNADGKEIRNLSWFDVVFCLLSGRPDVLLSR